eukprot:COSAG01_NODE_59171_length_301_cov_10.103960_2_plen_67_part_01
MCLPALTAGRCKERTKVNEGGRKIRKDTEQEPSSSGLRFGHVDHVDQAVHMDIWGGPENGPHMVHMV